MRSFAMLRHFRNVTPGFKNKEPRLVSPPDEDEVAAKKIKFNLILVSASQPLHGNRHRSVRICWLYRDRSRLLNAGLRMRFQCCCSINSDFRGNSSCIYDYPILCFVQTDKICLPLCCWRRPIMVRLFDNR